MNDAIQTDTAIGKRVVLGVYRDAHHDGDSEENRQIDKS